MQRDWVSTGTIALGAVLGLGYVAAGVVGWIADVTDGDGSDLLFWVLFLVGGGVLVLLGVFRLTSPPALSIALTAIGAVAGALALFWSIAVPLLALVLIALVVARSRRAGQAPA